MPLKFDPKERIDPRESPDIKPLENTTEWLHQDKNMSPVEGYNLIKQMVDTLIHEGYEVRFSVEVLSDNSSLIFGGQSDKVLFNAVLSAYKEAPLGGTK